MNPDAASTLARILEAGIEAFSREGPSHAATLEIAQKAGVAESTIFRRFDNKDNLFRECFRTTISRSLDPARFRALITAESAGDKCEFSRIVTAAVEHWYGSMPIPAARLVLFTSLSSSKRWRSLGSERINQIIAILAEKIEQEGQRQRTPDLDARTAAVSLIRSLLFLRSTRSNSRNEATADTCIRQWIFGLFPT